MVGLCFFMPKIQHFIKKEHKMSRYRKIDNEYYNDEIINGLSFDAHCAFITFLTHDTLNSLGMMKNTVESFAYGFSFRGSAFPKRLLKGLYELIEKGLVKQSHNSALLYAPNFVLHNMPENPNVIKGWYNCVTQFQHTEDLRQHIQYVRDLLESNEACKDWMLESFDDFFTDYLNPCTNPSDKHSTNQRNKGTEEQRILKTKQDKSCLSKKSPNASRKNKTLFDRKNIETNPAVYQQYFDEAREILDKKGENSTDAFIEEQFERFCDYWAATAQPKADWLATWRNWIRRSSDFKPKPRGQPHKTADKPTILTKTEYEMLKEMGYGNN